ncbi:unnamed protein product, partial [Mesorhabditis belari]|uniref:C-type lectin domain-containing protein n=1 Tax=Mesorhabditis belari TaxID=2138241 RepID=A0AAF3ELZ5_9BILA
MTRTKKDVDYASGRFLLAQILANNVPFTFGYVVCPFIWLATMDGWPLFCVFIFYFSNLLVYSGCQLYQGIVTIYLLPGSYLDTVRTCQALNAIPVKIQNIFENSFVYAIIEELNGLTPYIGVEKKVDGTWVYSDGSPLIYSNWDKGQPKNSTKLHCVTLDLASGKWIADDCSLARPSAC